MINLKFFCTWSLSLYYSRENSFENTDNLFLKHKRKSFWLTIKGVNHLWLTMKGVNYFWLIIKAVNHFWVTIKGVNHFWLIIKGVTFVNNKGVNYFWITIKGVNHFWVTIKGVNLFWLYYIIYIIYFQQYNNTYSYSCLSPLYVIV